MKQTKWTAVSVKTLDDLSLEQREAIVNSINAKQQRWAQLRSGLETLWKRIDAQVNQYDAFYTPLEKAEGNISFQTVGVAGSKIKTGNLHAHQEGIAASLIRYTFVNDYDFFDIPPLDATDTDSTSAVKAYLVKLFSDINLESKSYPVARALVRYGTAIIGYEWVKRVNARWRTNFIEDPESGLSIPMRYKAEEIEYDAPDLELLDIYTAYLDPVAKDPAAATLIYDRAVTAYELEANPIYSLSLEQIKMLTSPVRDNQNMAETHRQHAQGQTTFTMDAAYEGDLSLRACWGDITDGTILYQNYVAEIVGNQLIRFEPNPYDMANKPFLVVRLSVEPGSVYGHSPLAGAASLQAAFDTVLNQAIDSRSMHNERPWLLKQGAISGRAKENNKQQLPSFSRNLVLSVNGAVDQPLVRATDATYDGAAQDVTLLGLIDTQMKLVTGDNELTSGGAGIQNQYATTGHVVAVAEAGTARFALYAKSFEAEYLTPILRMTLDLLRQRELAPTTVTVPADDQSAARTMFQPEYLLNDIQFSLRGASYNATRQLQVNAAQSFYTMILGNPVTAQLMNWARVIIDMGDMLNIRQVRSQLSPQAVDIINSAPTQPGILQRMVNLFSANDTKNQTGQKPLLSTDPTGGVSVGNQFTQPMAAALGGPNPQGNNGPFDPGFRG